MRERPAPLGYCPIGRLFIGVEQQVASQLGFPAQGVGRA